jgi:hypothetical protein
VCLLSGTKETGKHRFPVFHFCPPSRRELGANPFLTCWQTRDQRIRQVAWRLVADHNCLSVVNLEVQPCASLPISSWESRGIVMTTSNPNFFTRGQLGWRRMKRIRQAGETECHSLTLQLYRSAIHAWFSSVTSMRRRPR